MLGAAVFLELEVLLESKTMMDRLRHWPERSISGGENLGSAWRGGPGQPFVLAANLVAASPVFGVPNGSMTRTWTSSRATGRCSTPLGTTNSSPGRSVTFPCLISITSVPLTTRTKSSVSSVVPDEFAERFGDEQVVSIELADAPGLPVVGERSELFCQICEIAALHLSGSRIQPFRLSTARGTT